MRKKSKRNKTQPPVGESFQEDHETLESDRNNSFDVRTFMPWVILIVALVCGVAWRVHDISVRSFHNDEGVNHHFIMQMREKGYYPYSHENYHGPSYFYMTQFFTDAFNFVSRNLGWYENYVGDEELSFRSSAIVAGLLTLLIPVMLIRVEGVWFASISCLLLAFLPSAIFYSRYAIHESLFVLLGISCAFSIYMWVRESRPLWVYFGFFCLGLLVSTKETFIITLFCLFFAAISLGEYRRVWGKFVESRAHFFWGSLLFSFVVIFTFSGGLRWPGGVREAFLAVPQWVGRNDSDTGHHKPYEYYLQVIGETEPILFLVLILPLLACVCFPRQIWHGLTSREFAFGRFATIWALLSFLVYSYVKYKTPWLIINLTIPAALALSWWISRMLRSDMSARLSGGMLLLTVISFCSWSAYRYNFEIPYGKRNPFSYVHTSVGMIDFIEDLHRYWKRDSNAKVLIATEAYWPLPYYVRGKASQVHYVKSDDIKAYLPRYEVLVMDNKVEFKDGQWAKKYYRLSEVQEANVYFKRIQS